MAISFRGIGADRGSQSMDEHKTKHWSLKSKVWLEVEGVPIMGEGRLAMLQAIERHGSILEASRTTGVSYRRIRGAIREMEEAVGQVLVESYRGGGEGGGASLTPAAHDLMARYKKVIHGFQEVIDVWFEQVFNS
jgi:molybdate transport system regulatory protein